MTYDDAHDELQYWTVYKQKYSHMSVKSMATVNNRMLYLEHIVSTTRTHTNDGVDWDVVYGWGIVAIGLIIVVLSCL